MTRKIKIINFIASMLVVVGSVFAISALSKNLGYIGTGKLILYYIIGIVISAFVCALFHELGHLLGAKISKFKIVSFCVWFFRFEKLKSGINFSLCFPDDTGYTEFYPKTKENLEKKFTLTTRLGLVFSALAVLICLPIFFVKTLPIFVFCMLSCFMPIGLYTLVSNSIPLVENGTRNDGAVLWGIRTNDDTTKVMFSLLKVQCELYEGKSFKDVDKKLLLDLPQLPEDDIYFGVMLLNKYRYYLDNADYKNAKKVLDRLATLKKYLPKSFIGEIGAENIFYNSFIEKNEDLADDIMYENEKYLNRVNDSVTIRAKLAYILFVKGEKDLFDTFYAKGIKEAKRQRLKGVKAFEISLLELVKEKFQK